MQLPATPPLRNRDEKPLTAMLCMTFGLRTSEGQMLVKLLMTEYCTKKNLADATAWAVAPNSVSVSLCRLRKKLAPHGIQIISTRGLGGYGLRHEGRNKILKQIDRYNQGLDAARLTQPSDAAAAP